MKRVQLLVTFHLLGWISQAIASTPAKPAVASEPAIAMSPFEVQAMSVDFKKWIKVGSPNFIVYTDGSNAEASTVLRELEMLRAAGQRFFGRRALKLAPIRVILPTASSDWRKLESKGNVEWKAAVSAEADEIAELIIVQYDWQQSGIWIVRAAQAYADSERLNLHGPFWFKRGIGKFYETAEFEKDSVTLGRVNPRTLHLQHAKWVPWGRFFAVDGKSQEFIKENTVKTLDAQCAVFSQYLYTNPERVWVDRLTLWLDYLNAGHAPTESEFKTIFTQDFSSWQKTMQRYTEDGRYRIYSVKVPPALMQYTETKFKMTDREMRDLFVLAQTLVQSVPASEASLDAVLAKGLKTEELRDLLVASCLKWKKTDAAMEHLRQLIASGSTNPRVYTLAVDRLVEKRAPVVSLDARLGDEAGEARAWCLRALELEPLWRDANYSLAWIEALAPEIDQDSIRTIEEVYRNIKGALPVDEVIMALAVALWRVGDLETARELCLKLKDAHLGTKQSRELAGTLFERLKATPK